MNRVRGWLPVFLFLTLIFSIKPRFGGGLSLRLTEPASLSLNTSNYSNLIFYSLIYENFFFLSAQGIIDSHIFSLYSYDSTTQTLTLEVKNPLYFSNGQEITPETVVASLKIFLDSEVYSAQKIGKVLKNIQQKNQIISLQFMQDVPDVLSLFTAPELVVYANNAKAFSGPFYPGEWVKGSSLVLKANPFYPGGRTYLDEVRITFTSSGKFDGFLSSPSQAVKEYRELNAGIFHNIYLLFPTGDVGQNTKVALYSLVKRFNSFIGYRFSELQSLTSDEESPVTLQIAPFPEKKEFSILKLANITLHILSSLGYLETEFNQYLGETKANIQAVFIDDAQLKNFSSSFPIKFLLFDRIFLKKSPLEEKLAQILKETGFFHLNEKYLKMLNELEETRLIKNQKLMMETIAKIETSLINEGFMLPLFQKKYSLYIHERLQNLEMDFYGRPLFQRVSLKNE